MFSDNSNPCLSRHVSEGSFFLVSDEDAYLDVHQTSLLHSMTHICQVFSIAGGTQGGTIGCGLYLEAATANHSCDPNASQSFDGKTLSLRCTRAIQRGEEITIGITQISRPGPLRRESLRTNYFFECQCERWVHSELDGTGRKQIGQRVH